MVNCMVICVVTCVVTRGLRNGYMLNMNYQINVWLCVCLRDCDMLVTCRLYDEKT